MLEVPFGHLRIVGDQPGQIHSVINAGVVKVQGKTIIHFDAFLDFFKFIDFYAVARFGNAMVEKDVAVAVTAKGFDFSEDFLGSHRMCSSSLPQEKEAVKCK